MPCRYCDNSAGLPLISGSARAVRVPPFSGQNGRNMAHWSGRSRMCSSIASAFSDSVISLVEGSQATHKTVRVGYEEQGQVEIITDDVKEGATVVTAGAFGLPAATRVKVLDQ